MPRFWLGFWRSKGTGRPVFGLTVPSERDEPVLLEEPTTFEARDLARRLLVEAHRHANKMP